MTDRMRGANVVVAVIALVAVSWAGPLIRLATEASAPAIAFWRTFVAGIVLLPFAVRGRMRSPEATARGKVPLFLLAGVFLAAHFATWVASIDLTTIASSALLVSLQPLIVGAVAAVVGERPNAKQWVAIGLACVGAALIGLSDSSKSAGSGIGDLLAVGGAIFGAGYLLAGRRLREAVPTALYASAVYLIASAVLLAVALVWGEPLWGFEPRTWIFLLLLAAGPQLAGHTGLNYLLPKMGVTWVVLAMMAEPVGSAIIAAILFAEIPGALVYPGGALILAGILLFMRFGRDNLGESSGRA